MHKYRVVECFSEERRLTLRCSRGQYHIVRALSVLPGLDAMLEGARPHLGFGLLSCPKSGAIFRVIFESFGHAAIPLAPHTGPVDQFPQAEREVRGAEAR